MSFLPGMIGWKLGQSAANSDCWLNRMLDRVFAFVFGMGQRMGQLLIDKTLGNPRLSAYMDKKLDERDNKGK